MKYTLLNPVGKIQSFLFPSPFRKKPNSFSMGMLLPRLVLLFAIMPLALSQESSPSAFNSHILPRPLILEYQVPDDSLIAQTTAAHLRKEQEKQEEELRVLECTSWRVAVEANNLNPWTTVPEECASYVREYVTGKGYSFDLERVSREAGVYAKSVELGGDGMDAWVFDVDETLLSNLPYYADHAYGLETFNPVEFDKWVDKAGAPAIESSLRLYKEVLDLGFKVFFLTGRSEEQRNVTEENLRNAGFQRWDNLIMRGPDDHEKLAVVYKSEKRSEIVKEGYRILGNSGDQWSDLLGSEMSSRSFKLPNPMYYIP